MQNLKPCPYRQVDDEGHILCDKIKSGDREVSPNVCRACPVSAINCAHLRATLDHQTRPPITVRYGNGKTEIWEDAAPSISLARAACAVKVTPILSPRDCAGCPLRQALISPDAITVATRDDRARDLGIGGRAESSPVAPPAPLLTPAKPATDSRPAPIVPAVSAPPPRARPAARARRVAPQATGPAPVIPSVSAAPDVSRGANAKAAGTRAQRRAKPVSATAANPAPAVDDTPPPTIAVAPNPAVARSRAMAPTGASTAAHAPNGGDAAEQQRSSIVAQKIIKLQEWLEKQKNAPRPGPSDFSGIEVDSEAGANFVPRRAATSGMPPLPRPPRLEEKRVGWTD